MSYIIVLGAPSHVLVQSVPEFDIEAERRQKRKEFWYVSNGIHETKYRCLLKSGLIRKYRKVISDSP